MKFARLTSRLAVGGVTAALATAGLVGVTSTSASAAPVTTNYTCTLPAPFGDKTFAVTVDVPLVPPTAPAGFPVPAGLFSFKSSVLVPADVAAGLPASTVDGAKSDDFSTSFGSLVAKAPVVWGTRTDNLDGTATLSGSGSNQAFQLPKAGTYSVAMPKQFTLIPTKSGTALPLAAPCKSASPAQIASITLSKQASVTKVKAAKKVKKGAVESVKIKVTNDYSKTGGVVPTGKVTIKDGKKTIGKGKLKNGKVTIKVKSLKVGTHKLVVKYGGDGYTDKSKSKTLKVTVTK